MDPLSISTGALAIAGTIGRLSITISAFVREVRDARNDMDEVLRELVSLKTTLEMLAEDTEGQKSNDLPGSLTKQISGILNGCDRVIHLYRVEALPSLAMDQRWYMKWKSLKPELSRSRA
jgi:hypothetical protein